MSFDFFVFYSFDLLFRKMFISRFLFTTIKPKILNTKHKNNKSVDKVQLIKYNNIVELNFQHSKRAEKEGNLSLSGVTRFVCKYLLLKDCFFCTKRFYCL